MDPPYCLEMLIELPNALLRRPLKILVWLQRLDKKPPHLGRICPCDAGAVEHTFYEEYFYSAQLTFRRKDVEELFVSNRSDMVRQRPISKRTIPALKKSYLLSNSAVVSMYLGC